MMRNECQKCGYCSTPARNCAGCGGNGTMLHVDEERDRLRKCEAALSKCVEMMDWYGDHIPDGADDFDDACEKARAALVSSVTRLAVVISDNIGLRCGHRGWIAAVHMLVKQGASWRIESVVECRECSATWTWGQP